MHTLEYLIANQVAVCAGDCGMTFMERDLRTFHGADYCDTCFPKCVAPDCNRKQHELGYELCAKCSLEIAREEQKMHWNHIAVPISETWLREGLALDVQCKIWEGRQ